MNILLISYRDIHAEDAGGSRTMILKCNYLASIPGIKVFTAYRNLSPVDERITEIPLQTVTAQSVREIIIKYKIDVLDIPEGERYAALGRKAVEGLMCAVVTEFHSKPGYEMIGLKRRIIEQGAGSKIGVILAWCKLALYPVYRFYLKTKSLPRFQNAALCADKFVVLAPSYIQEYKQVYKIPNVDNIVSIGNALTFENPISEADLLNKEKIILVVSRLDEQNKRISLALKVWSLLQEQFPDWRMQIVGSGPSENEYRQFISKHNLQRVTLEGRQSPESYYTKASIFLMTSAYEGWGMTLTEAQQKGCVPIAMNSYSALGCIINDGVDGYIVSDNDINNMIDKTKLLITDYKLREKMSRKGVENCRRFAMANIGSEWVKLFNDLIGK